MTTLLTIDQAAESLGMSKDTLRWHIGQGEIRYVTIGSGRKRVHRLFDPADLAAFVESRKGFACPSIGRRAPRRTSTTSNGEVIGFRARQALRPSGKLSR